MTVRLVGVFLVMGWVLSAHSQSTLRATPTQQGNTPAPQAKEDLLDYADLLYSQKQYPLAAEQYQRFIHNHSSSPNLQAAWFRLGECYLQVGQRDDAKKTFSYLVKKYKTGVFVGSASYRLAVMAFNEGDYEEAKGLFATAMKEISSPQARLQAQFYFARSNQLIGDYDTAEIGYETIINGTKNPDDNPFYERCLIETARLFFDKGDLNKSLSRYEKIIELNNNPEYVAESLSRAGHIAGQLGARDKSNNYLEKAIQSDYESTWKALAHVELILNYYASKDYDRVISIYESGRVNAPEGARAKMLLTIGNAYRFKQAYDEAIGLYKLVEKNYRDQPEGAEAGYRRLQCVLLKGDGGLPILVRDYIEKQNTYDPDIPFIDLAYLMKAEWHFAEADSLIDGGDPETIQGHYREAAKAYKQIRENMIDEKFHEPRLYKLGWSQVEGGEPQLGMLSLTKFIENFPSSDLLPSALAKRATGYQAIGDSVSALADFKELADKFPDAPDTEYAMQQIGLLHTIRREMKQAVQAFEALLAKYPETSVAGEANFWIGVGNFDRENFNEAIIAFKKAREIDPFEYDDKASLRIVHSYYQLEEVPNLQRETEHLLEIIDKQKANDESNEDEKNEVIELPVRVIDYLGQKLYEQKDYESAEKFLARIADFQNPKNTEPQVWRRLSDARQKLGLNKAAIDSLTAYLDITNNLAERASAFVNKGRSHLALEEYEKARESSHESLRVQKQGKTNAKARILLADVSMAEGDYETAAKDYLVVSQVFKDPELTPDALKKAAEAYRLTGDSDKAAELEEQLRIDFPDYEG